MAGYALRQRRWEVLRSISFTRTPHLRPVTVTVQNLEIRLTTGHQDLLTLLRIVGYGP